MIHTNHHNILKKQFVIIVLCCLLLVTKAQAQYTLNVNYVGKDNAFATAKNKLQTSFSDVIACNTYINNLPALLSSKGYPTASVDSVWSNENNTATNINLFLGLDFVARRPL